MNLHIHYKPLLRHSVNFSLNSHQMPLFSLQVVTKLDSCKFWCGLAKYKDTDYDVDDDDYPYKVRTTRNMHSTCGTSIYIILSILFFYTNMKLSLMYLDNSMFVFIGSCRLCFGVVNHCPFYCCCRANVLYAFMHQNKEKKQNAHRNT